MLHDVIACSTVSYCVTSYYSIFIILYYSRIYLSTLYDIRTYYVIKRYTSTCIAFYSILFYSILFHYITSYYMLYDMALYPSTFCYMNVIYDSRLYLYHITLCCAELYRYDVILQL